MNYTKVLFNFSHAKFTDSDLILKGGFIVEHLTGNTHFPTPFPFLTELINTTAEFKAAFLKANEGSREDTSVKNKLRDDLEFLLRKIALYVETQSSGDATAILSAGFNTRKLREPIGPLDKPTRLIVQYGLNSGEITMQCDVINKARIYEFQYTESPLTPNSVWTNVSSTKRKVNVNGLSRGVEYIFRVAGMNTDPSRNWSEPVTKLVV